MPGAAPDRLRDRRPARPECRQHLLAQSTGDATILPWMPDTNDGIGPDAQGPRAMVMAGDQLWVGGQFTKVNSASQQGLTRFGL